MMTITTEGPTTLKPLGLNKLQYFFFKMGIEKNSAYYEIEGVQQIN